jgi:hypothetical protein
LELREFYMRFIDYLKPFFESSIVNFKRIPEELKEEEVRAFIAIGGILLLLYGVFLLLTGATNLHYLTVLIIGLLFVSGYMYSSEFSEKQVIWIMSIWAVFIISYFSRITGRNNEASILLLSGFGMVIATRWIYGEYTEEVKTVEGYETVTKINNPKMYQISHDFYFVIGLFLLLASIFDLKFFNDFSLSVSGEASEKIELLLKALISFFANKTGDVFIDIVVGGYSNPLTLFILGSASVLKASAVKTFEPDKPSYLTPIAILIASVAFFIKVMWNLIRFPSDFSIQYVADLTLFAILAVIFLVKYDKLVKRILKKPNPTPTIEP